MLGVGDQLDDAQLLLVVAAQEQHAGVQLQGAMEELQHVVELLVHLFDARPEEPLLVGGAAGGRRAHQPEHARLVAQLLPLVVQGPAGAVPHPGDLGAGEEQVEHPEERDEQRVGSEGLPVAAGLGPEPQGAFEPQRDDDQQGAHGLTGESGDEGHHRVDERIERAGEPAADLNGGVGGDQRHRAQLQVDPGDALVALAPEELAPARRQPSSEDGRPGDGHRGVFHAQLPRADPEDAQEVQGRDRERGEQAVGAPNGPAKGQGGVNQRRHRALRALRSRRVRGQQIDSSARPRGSARACPAVHDDRSSLQPTPAPAVPIARGRGITRPSMARAHRCAPSGPWRQTSTGTSASSANCMLASRVRWTGARPPPR